jgi:hypothetical protein
MRSIPNGNPADVTLMLAPSCSPNVRLNTEAHHWQLRTCSNTDVAPAWPPAKVKINYTSIEKNFGEKY